MPIRPELLMRGLDGRPQPPRELVEKLKRYDPRIGLWYTNAAWAITEAWKETDPRREWIQQGQMQAEMAFDICGYLPITCSLDEALPYIERELRSYTADQFQALRHAVNHWNDVEQDNAVLDTVMGEVSNALDKSNDVSPGISTTVTVDIAPKPQLTLSRAERRRAAKGG